MWQAGTKISSGPGDIQVGWLKSGLGRMIFFISWMRPKNMLVFLLACWSIVVVATIHVLGKLERRRQCKQPSCNFNVLCLIFSYDFTNKSKTFLCSNVSAKCFFPPTHFGVLITFFTYSNMRVKTGRYLRHLLRPAVAALARILPS